MSEKNTELRGAIDHLHNELYAIQQQLCLLSDLTAREHVDNAMLALKPTGFSVTMACLAEQVQAAMDYTAALNMLIGNS